MRVPEILLAILGLESGPEGNLVRVLTVVIRDG